ncbi:dephospho-CoA kinase [Chamaesiphon sp. VAR_69_metabat_338]|uniref:dephospho-CoA kinase n=1 Tax=Chamaesiphon sp. VAR_69_metabat_338 TaxID=2964704 RepID=UPI00286DDBE8|nr:dephospho-CoA kinase [Chamaesiphon sp. VAR_69_metabat_338]
MRLIGITGGIGTGKSTVTNYLQTRYSLPILDADIYARAAVAVGSPILKAIRQHYGDDILQPDGTLDRPQLGAIVFSNPTERQWLESQIHPYVRDCFDREINQLQPDATAVLAIPLLFEAKITDLVTEIWVVSCDLPTQLHRVMTRDRIDELAAKNRIDSQMPLAEKIALADVNLDNSTTLEHLERQIDRHLNLKH